MKYAVEQRLRLIDFLLSQYGAVNRSAVMDFFGVSMPQASLDIQAYLALAPSNAAYCLTRKTYVRATGFKRVWT